MHISATVPLLTAIACFVPMKAAQRSSSSAVSRPPASIPLSQDVVTAAISSGPDIGACDRDHAVSSLQVCGSGRSSSASSSRANA